VSDTVNRLNARLIRTERERDELRKEKLVADLTLSIFLTAFRRELVDYRANPALDIATPTQVIGAVIDALDRAMVKTKATQTGKGAVESE
jgi:hypothetical protein